MWWAYTRGGLYSGGGLIVGGLRYRILYITLKNIYILFLALLDFCISDPFLIPVNKVFV